MDFFKSIFNETYSIGSEYISKHIGTNSNGTILSSMTPRERERERVMEDRMKKVDPL